MSLRLRAANRFGLGARIGDAAGAGDPRAWLDSQLDGPPPLLEPEGLTGLDGVGSLLPRLRAAQRAQDQEALRRLREEQRRIVTGELQAAFSERLRSERPFVERLVAFFSNHLCISVQGEPTILSLAGHYERTVVRPHVLGRYEDMVLASARHPAMLVYLDNARSIGPDSPGARFANRRREQDVGLNENYARELLELHTLGVDGGYTQADVEALARIFTGWTVAGLGPGGRRNEAFGFVFRPAIHQPGTKTVLGRRYADAGEREGEAVVRDLCRHPSTARFLAGKLVSHFVADRPPANAVARIAGTWKETGGDLRAVARALVRLDAAWEPENRKFRSPQDWLVAVFRAVNADEAPEPFPALFRQLRHTPWAPPSPKGYGDTAREWADPDSLMNRAELARTVAGHMARGGLDPERLLEVVDVSADDPLRTLLADTSIDASERLALAIGGPAFQWR